jgi:hypothetical protein
MTFLILGEDDCFDWIQVRKRTGKTRTAGMIYLLMEFIYSIKYKVCIKIPGFCVECALQD